MAATLCAASGAQAQNCSFAANPFIPNLGSIGAGVTAVGSMIGSSIAASSTAFLLQSSSFVGAPANPAPDQQGGGIWVRGVGGEVNVKSTTGTAVTGISTGIPGGATTAAVNCAAKVQTDFAGVQFGTDVSRLNLNGWNLHSGVTAGYIGTFSKLSGGFFQGVDGATGIPGNLTIGGGPFTSNADIPFIGIYGAATKGGFFADALLRAEYYHSSLAAPGANLYGAPLDAHGWSFAASAGYNWSVPNSNWFIEPSGTLIVSQVKVDPFALTSAGINFPGVPGVPGSAFTDRNPGTLTINTVQSEIGRLGLRVGETIQSGNLVWQPFGAVSVWHEFGRDPSGSYATTPGCCIITGTVPGTTTGPFTGLATARMSTVGTFGQYSLGTSVALAGTGWLGFVRVDYRDGPNLEGLSGTGGIRYQFTPDAPKAGIFKAKAPPVVQAVNWTGFYVGANVGAVLGTADWGYGVGEVAPHVAGYLAGGTVGYDWQTGRWVLGAVADLDATNLRGGMSCNPGGGTIAAGPPGPMLLTACNARAAWIGDVAARLGYTWDRALLYVKGGGAWTNERFTANCTNSTGPVPAFVAGWQCANPAQVPTTGFAASTSRTGWLAGWGAQFALTQNLSAKAESNYISFGDRNVIASDGSALRVGMHVWEEKIGLNYRFNTGP
ncbi:MAG TPA: autotransporter outer membrane beta-barrel domain-containing protein [Xanthobacteraceae bacterium]|jgi:opacity protein-like surface antigen|nr:autotransporter outer membrane beta-barrel domain-containing protein [Xanthobacteraceae bacterium]